MLSAYPSLRSVCLPFGAETKEKSGGLFTCGEDNADEDIEPVDSPRELDEEKNQENLFGTRVASFLALVCCRWYDFFLHKLDVTVELRLWQHVYRKEMKLDVVYWRVGVVGGVVVLG